MTVRSPGVPVRRHQTGVHCGVRGRGRRAGCATPARDERGPRNRSAENDLLVAHRVVVGLDLDEPLHTELILTLAASGRRSLPELSLVGEHRRGHGGLYAGLAHGRLDTDRLRRALVTGPLPRAADGRLVLAVDITCWLRPEAHTSPRRILCHTYGRGKDTHVMVPGWPYSVIVALETGPEFVDRTPWPRCGWHQATMPRP